MRGPAITAAMAEIGLDLSREFPKPLTGDQVQAADVVITMGCGDAWADGPDWLTGLTGLAAHGSQSRRGGCC